MNSPLDRREFLASAVSVAGGWSISAIAADARAPCPRRPPPLPKTKPPFRISKETTYITKPLRPNGRPDYLAVLDAVTRQGVTPENNALVPYIRAIGPENIPEEKRDTFFAKLGIEPLPMKGSYLTNGLKDYQKNGLEFDEWIKRWDRSAEIPWTRDELPRVAEVLERNERPLRLIVEGTRRPRLYVPLVDSPDHPAPLSNAALVFSPAMNLHSAAGLLVRRAMRHLGEGRPREAEADLLACHHVARRTAQQSFLIDRLMAWSLDAMAQRGDIALAHHGGLSADELLRYGAKLAELPPFPSWSEVFARDERYYQLEGIIGILDGHELIFESLEFLGGKKTADRLRALLATGGIDWNVVLVRVNEFHDRVAEIARIESRVERRLQAEKHSAVMEKRAAAVVDEAGRRPREANPGRSAGEQFVDLLIGSPPLIAARSFMAEDRNDTHFSLARLAIALAAFRAATGSYPETLEELAPKTVEGNSTVLVREFIEAIPTDLFSKDAQPPIYRRDDDQAGYLLYSIGENEKDDGGRVSGVEPRADDLTIRTSN